MVSSPRIRSRRASRRTRGVVAVAVIGTLALTGCVSSAKPGASPSATATVAAPALPGVASATPAPTSSAPPTPVTLTCPQIMTPAQVYAFNPNYGPKPGYTPSSGTLESTIVADKGVACGWLNQSSNAVIQAAVAKPAASSMDALKNSAITSSHPVPTYGVPPQVEGYFTVVNGAGEVQAFTGAYWVVVDSPEFQEPGDAAPFMQSLLGNLPS